MPALQELRFAVADSGAGLLTTLARRGAVSDAAAIGLALDGVSRFDAPDRGGGLRTTVELVSALGGTVLVASGRAAASDSGSGRSISEHEYAFTGTLVESAIPLRGGRHARPFG